MDDDGNIQNFNLKRDKTEILYKELGLASAALSPLLRVLINVPPRRYHPGMVEPIRRPTDEDGWLPRRSLNADHSIPIKRSKVEKAIQEGHLTQVTDVDQISDGEDIIWLRGTNQGKLANNTYLATKSNNIFECGETEMGVQEMGMGIPETGNSGWGVMLRETKSGQRRGFSFEKRGKAYQYVEDWMLNLNQQAENDADDDYSTVNIALEAVHEGKGVVHSIALGKGLRKIGFGLVVKMLGEQSGGRKFKIGKGGLTNDMLKGVADGDVRNLPQVGQLIQYKYCALVSDGYFFSDFKCVSPLLFSFNLCSLCICFPGLLVKCTMSC